MGCCASKNAITLEHQLSFETNSTTSKSANKSIQKYLNENEKQDSRVIKMLLLGAGSGGKSTLFRQIESIHGDNYADIHDDGNTQYFTSLLEIKHDIKTNCLLSITKLLKKSEDLSIEPHNFIDCKVDTSNENIVNAIRIISIEEKRNLEDMDAKCPNLAQVGKSINFIWSLDGIQNTFKKRQFFSLIENIEYFFNKIQDIMGPDDEFVPNREDVLLSRIRNTGILPRQY
eukprot:UN07000